MPLDDEPFKGPDAKPAKRERTPTRIVNRKATAKAVLTEPTCCVCGNRSATGHHVVARGKRWQGDDVPENIVALCGSGTTGCHGDVEARRGDAREKVGAYLLRERPDVIAYVLHKISPGGAAWLRRHYHVKL